MVSVPKHEESLTCADNSYTDVNIAFDKYIWYFTFEILHVTSFLRFLNRFYFCARLTNPLRISNRVMIFESKQSKHSWVEPRLFHDPNGRDKVLPVRACNSLGHPHRRYSKVLLSMFLSYTNFRQETAITIFINKQTKYTQNDMEFHSENHFVRHIPYIHAQIHSFTQTFNTTDDRVILGNLFLEIFNCSTTNTL